MNSFMLDVTTPSIVAYLSSEQINLISICLEY